MAAERSITAWTIALAALFGAATGGGTAWLLRTPPTDLTAERERLTDLESNLELSRREIERLEREFATERAATTLLRERLEVERERRTSGSGASATGEPKRPIEPLRLDQETASAAAGELLERLFEEVSIGGSLAAVGPPGTQFVGIARAFPEVAIELLESRLAATRPDTRVAAIRLAGRFGGTPLIEPLTRAALEDPSDLVRIFAAEALASLPAPAAIPSWLALIEAEGPSGVRLHAWTGLARAGHSAAVERFVPILDRSDASIPADAVVDTALSMADPRLLPAVRAAFSHASLSETHNIAILRTLARAGGEWTAFVTAVGLSEDTPATLAEVALALAPPPPAPPEPEPESVGESAEPGGAGEAEEGERSGEGRS